jgi:integrase
MAAGTLVWLVMTTGMRRGEVCALRWRHVDLDAETIEIRRNYVLHKGVGVEKDTKTHPMRRIVLDSETVALLRDHQRRLQVRVEELGSAVMIAELYVFGGVKSPDHSAPCSPHAVSSRYADMAERRPPDLARFEDAGPLSRNRFAGPGIRSALSDPDRVRSSEDVPSPAERLCN